MDDPQRGYLARELSFLMREVIAMNRLLLIIITILLPPLGVFLEHGLSTTFWINLVLTILGYIPGVIHGVIVNV